MGILKGKPDGGQGGKRGHSNMDHWVYTEEIKEASRKRRRISAKLEIREGLIEDTTAHDDKLDPPETTDEFSK
ncbi:MAG: hypothetical protein QOF62_1760 [Pyrinomonadaceae bacterium]|jgi:hypothetical protein|nr:hypothetical protein [Pyrinomonadaceae bacterium]